MPRWNKINLTLFLPACRATVTTIEARTSLGRDQGGRNNGRRGSGDQPSSNCAQDSPYTVTLTKVNNRLKKYCWTIRRALDQCTSSSGECCAEPLNKFVLRDLGESASTSLA